MSYGSGSTSRRFDIEDKEGMRIVYNSCGLPVQIRTFRADAKLNDPVDAWDFIYDDCYNLINTMKSTQAEFVNNLDIRVPEQPKIISLDPIELSTNPTINGTVSGEIVKDGDIVEIYELKSRSVVGSGNVDSESFSIELDLNKYSGEVSLFAIVYNDRRRRNGGSAQSIEFIYKIS